MLILAGGLGFLQAFGYLAGCFRCFLGTRLPGGGRRFSCSLFASNFASGGWWAAFPGFVLAGIGVLILLPDALDDIGGAMFLGAIGLSFWAVYLTGRDRWWAIIPGGVLFTLAAVSALPEQWLGGADSGGVFFLGLAADLLAGGAPGQDELGLLAGRGAGCFRSLPVLPIADLPAVVPCRSSVDRRGCVHYLALTSISNSWYLTGNQKTAAR